MTSLSLSSFLRLLQPTRLILALLAYGLGLGLARYLGVDSQPALQAAGAASLLLILAASNLLYVYFLPLQDPTLPGADLPARQKTKPILLSLAAALLAAAATLSLFLYSQKVIQPLALSLQAAFVFLSAAYAIPPLRLAARGLGEPAQALLLIVFPPMLAFLLQSASLHRFLLLYTFPLYLLANASLLALNVLTFAEDQRNSRRTALQQLGWARGITLHHSLLSLGYLLLALTPLFGLPVSLVWTGLLPLPLAAYQVFQLNNLAAGQKPQWLLLQTTILANLALTVYLLTYTLWIH
jgi:1,4-dihydroxy-2-naphthoate octaprenyltransferase